MKERTKRSSPLYEIEVIKAIQVMKKEGLNFRLAFMKVLKREPGGHDYREARKLGYKDENLYKINKRSVLR